MISNIKNDKLRSSYDYFNSIEKVFDDTEYIEKRLEVNEKIADYIGNLRKRCGLLFTLDLISIFEDELKKIVGIVGKLKRFQDEVAKIMKQNSFSKDDIKTVKDIIDDRHTLAHGERDFESKTNLTIEEICKLLDDVLDDIRKNKRKVLQDRRIM